MVSVLGPHWSSQLTPGLEYEDRAPLSAGALSQMVTPIDSQAGPAGPISGAHLTLLGSGPRWSLLHVPSTLTEPLSPERKHAVTVRPVEAAALCMTVSCVTYFFVYTGATKKPGFLFFFLLL